MTEALAYIGCFILFNLAVFQFALIVGAPIGNYAWGGKHKVLPKNMRIASAFSIVLYIFFAFVLLAKAGIGGFNFDKSYIDAAIWIITVYFFLGIFMNAISRSKPERMVMTPVAAALALLFLSVALLAK